MQKHEFEERIESTVSDEDYKLIEFVYQFHPVIRNVSGKDEVAELYKSFGMALLEGFEIDEAAMGELISRATNNNNGCFRLLDRTLNNVLRVLRERGETKVTLKIVSEASSMMML